MNNRKEYLIYVFHSVIISALHKYYFISMNNIN